MSELIRCTVSLTPETIEAFKEMAEVSNTSFSKCVGEWLQDTTESAQFVTAKMRDARQAPARVMRELFSSASPDDHILQFASKAGALPPAASVPKAAGRRGAPPSSNTGGYGSTQRGRK